MALTLRLRLRPDHRRDRAGLPGARGDDGGPDHPGEEEDRGGPHPVPGAGPRPSCRRGSTRCSPSCTWCSRPGTPRPGGDAGARRDLVERALELGRLLRRLMPDEPEVRGLLALMLLTDARRATRGRRRRAAGAARRPGPRPLGPRAVPRGWPWSATCTTAGSGGSGCRPRSPPSTRWRRRTPRPTGTAVVRLYDALLREWPSPVVALNRAVALAEVAGPEAGLAEVDRLAAEGRLAGYRYLPATRADLLRRLGRQARRRRRTTTRWPWPTTRWSRTSSPTGSAPCPTRADTTRVVPDTRRPGRTIPSREPVDSSLALDNNS